MQAMHDIYGDETPAKWIKKWGEPQNKEQADAILRKEKDWCVENDFNFTPRGSNQWQTCSKRISAR